MSNIPINIPNVKFIDYRDEIWGDSYNWSFARSLSQVDRLVIHHSVTTRNASPQAIALLHKARGWAGIGYHIVITENGDVYYCGDIGTGRANVANQNQRVIGILLVGTFMNGEQPTKAQIRSAHYVCKYFQTQFPALTKITGWDQVVGHKEMQATACPGDTWKNVTNDVFSQIKNFKENSPEPSNPSPNPSNDDYYRITFKGKQLIATKRNPLDYIKELETKLNAIVKITNETKTSIPVSKLKEILRK